MKQATLEQRVLRFIEEHKLLANGKVLLVAVSGGPDSVCLLHVLEKLREKLGLNLHAAHLNHQLRGAESEADARFVAQITEQLAIPAAIETRDVASYQAQHRLSPEEAAREVRYTFLTEVATAIGADRVAVGHTVDDHVETILMHLVRGSGTRGLRGLQPVNRWQFGGKKLTVIRPLLEISREETAAYCHQHRLKPRLDTSNLSLSPLRNRIRHQLLPLLQSYNPRVIQALLRTGRLAEDELDFLDIETGRLWHEVVAEGNNAIIFHKQKLGQLEPALQRHLLRAGIEQLAGNLKDIEAGHIDDLINALPKPTGKRISLPYGLTFAIEYDSYRLGVYPAARSPFPPLQSEVPLTVPGQTSLPGGEITALITGKEETSEKGDEFTACLDFDRVGSRLTVRPRQYGDRFQPQGMSQPKKLGEFMIDAKIPRAWRPNIPLICSPHNIIWVIGWRIDERAKVTETTEQVLHLKFSRR